MGYLQTSRCARGTSWHPFGYLQLFVPPLFTQDPTGLRRAAAFCGNKPRRQEAYD